MSEPAHQRSDLQSELETRTAQRDILAAFFKAHPMTVHSAEALIAVVGPNYRSRVSECDRDLGMHVQNVPRWREYVNTRGKVKRVRLIGGYQYLPYEPLGRSADVPATEAWPVYDAPYSEPFRLT